MSAEPAEEADVILKNILCDSASALWLLSLLTSPPPPLITALQLFDSSSNVFCPSASLEGDDVTTRELCKFAPVKREFVFRSSTTV